MPLSFELGEAYQFDWSDEAMVVGGVFYNVQVAHLKLCANRASQDLPLIDHPAEEPKAIFS